MSRLVVVGDALLDRDLHGEIERLCPEAPAPVVEGLRISSRPGGAALAATLAAGEGHEVTFVTALGEGSAGREVAALLNQLDIRVVDLRLDGRTPQKVRVLSRGHLLLRLDHADPSAPGTGPLNGEARAALRWAEGILVSDYGRGLAARRDLRATLVEAAERIPVVWDPHPKGCAPILGVRLATPNSVEAAGFAGAVHAAGIAGVDVHARTLLERWRAEAVAVTLGREGALLHEVGRSPLLIPSTDADGDVCGAGDRFAVTAAGFLAEGASVASAVEGAVRAATSFVADGGAGSVALPAGWPVAAPLLPPGSAEQLAAAIRSRGGTVVATGGCFDLLHAGHVAMLEAARSLGDCLVVCLNSDASVRRLKGSGRPLQRQEDRAAVLEALRAVDAVAIFDEDTPEPLLTRLRPDVWAKGADYTERRLPEASVLRQWGGRVEILPYVEGRSTTGLIQALEFGA